MWVTFFFCFLCFHLVQGIVNLTLFKVIIAYKVVLGFLGLVLTQPHKAIL